ncbi:MAG: hypothetical protein HY276_05970 [Ignavibacteriales bacterium]|nr:hypothetical protein [Ignavibacteriales bacterium]
MTFLRVLSPSYIIVAIAAIFNYSANPNITNSNFEEFWHLLPSSGYATGFMPYNSGSSEQLQGWYKCYGARAILTKKEVSGQVDAAVSIGYIEIMSNGYNGIGGEWPRSAPSAVTHIYLDEPLSRNADWSYHWNTSTLHALGDSCSRAGKFLVVGESMSSASYPPYSNLSAFIDTIISSIDASFRDSLIIMPMHYFNNGWSPAGTNGGSVGSINAWWTALDSVYSSINFVPWLSTTCEYNPGTSGCTSGWIQSSLAHANSLGWKKVYFYLDDGFPSTFVNGIRNSLINTSWAYTAGDDAPANGCQYYLGEN